MLPRKGTRVAENTEWQCRQNNGVAYEYTSDASDIPTSEMIRLQSGVRKPRKGAGAGAGAEERTARTSYS